MYIVKKVKDAAYQQGRADAIKEIRIKVLELYKSCRGWWKFYNTLINDILEVEEEEQEQ